MTDLPKGYRWAVAEETENLDSLVGYIVVPLTADSKGKPYTHGEADIAVPIDDLYREGYQDAKTLIASIEDIPLARAAVPPAMPETYQIGFLDACDDSEKEVSK